MKQTTKITRVLAILLALLMAFSVAVCAAEALTVTATYDGADLEGATVPAGGVISLAFSNNVTDESVLDANKSRIKVKDAEGVEAAVTIDAADKNTFTVTLGSDLAKGSYTLTLGRELAAKNGLTLGQKVEYTFTVKGSGSGTGGGDKKLQLQSVTLNGEPLEGAKVQAGDKIVIAFSNGMVDNAEANFALISVKKDDGTDASYTIETNKDKSNENAKREYIVTFGENESGNYTLVIGADVKANNGNTLGEDVTVAFTVPTLFARILAYLDNLFAPVKDFFVGIINFIRLHLAVLRPKAA